MSKRVFVTGHGIITALGVGIAENLRQLLAKKSGLKSVTLFDTIHRRIPVGQVGFSNEELVKLSGLQDNKEILTRTTLLGYLAAKEAFASFSTKMAACRTGIISATTVGGMCSTEQYYEDLLTNDRYRKHIDSFDSADSTVQIAKLLGIKGEITTINTACSSSANAIMLGTRLIKAGKLDAVLVGGTESLTKFAINGFNTLEILDNEPCRPFDRRRKGINIGEGAGFLLLQSEDSCQDHQMICEITGYGNANDAFHPTASSPHGIGAQLAMQKALIKANLLPEDIGYINAHGTGTDINDLSEGRALEIIFKSSVPPVSSTKNYTGHTLGASGGIESVFSILGLTHDILFPNLNLMEPMDELSFIPQREVRENYSFNQVLSNSFGFGGNCTSLIFSKI